MIFSELGLISVDLSKTSRQPTRSVNSTSTNTALTELQSMITFHHANTRGSGASRLRIAHLCVLKQLSSTYHVTFFAAPNTDHKHKFSLESHQHTQDLWYTIHIYPAKFHGRQSGGSTQIPSLTVVDAGHLSKISLHISAQDETTNVGARR